MKNRMTKNNVYTLAYLVVLFSFIFPTTKILAETSQVSVIVPPELKITILGFNPFTLLVGRPYIDAGAVVIDTSFGVVPVTTILNNVNPSVLGEYSVVYRAVDIAGSVEVATRTVKVVNPRRVSTDGSEDVGGSIESIISESDLNYELESALPDGFCFTKNLDSYKSDPDVKNLKIFLNENGFETVGEFDNDYYGVETVNAVTLFQEQKTFVPFMPFGSIAVNGLFDDITRTKANIILGCEIISETQTQDDVVVPDESVIGEGSGINITNQTTEQEQNNGLITVPQEKNIVEIIDQEIVIRPQKSIPITIIPKVTPLSIASTVWDRVIQFFGSIVQGFVSIFGF